MSVLPKFGSKVFFDKLVGPLSTLQQNKVGGCNPISSVNEDWKVKGKSEWCNLFCSCKNTSKLVGL